MTNCARCGEDRYPQSAICAPCAKKIIADLESALLRLWSEVYRHHAETGYELAERADRARRFADDAMHAARKALEAQP